MFRCNNFFSELLLNLINRVHHLRRTSQNVFIKIESLISQKKGATFKKIKRFVRHIRFLDVHGVSVNVFKFGEAVVLTKKYILTYIMLDFYHI